MPALREALMDYREISPLFGGLEPSAPPSIGELRRDVGTAWEDYQSSRFGRLTRNLPIVLAEAQLAAEEYDGRERAQAQAQLALAHQPRLRC